MFKCHSSSSSSSQCCCSLRLLDVCLLVDTMTVRKLVLNDRMCVPVQHRQVPQPSPRLSAVIVVRDNRFRVCFDQQIGGYCRAGPLSIYGNLSSSTATALVHIHPELQEHTIRVGMSDLKPRGLLQTPPPFPCCDDAVLLRASIYHTRHLVPHTSTKYYSTW